MSKNKEVKIELVVIGSGDTSVDIFPSQEEVTVTFHDQDENTIDKAEMTQMLKEFFKEAMENFRTTVLTVEEYEEDRRREAEWEEKHLEEK